jgi:hypothetical protein
MKQPSIITHPQRHRQACCLEVHACIITGVQRDAWRASGVKLHAMEKKSRSKAVPFQQLLQSPTRPS